MKASAALVGGLAGTCIVALLHETLKKITPDAPRMELLDMEALSKLLDTVGIKVPEQDDLLKLTLGGEILSHTVYYSLPGMTGSKKGMWLRGAFLGLVAGITAVALPKPLGLHGAPSNRTPQTEAMTIALYLIGGLTAAAVSKWLIEREETKEALKYEVAQAMDY